TGVDGCSKTFGRGRAARTRLRSAVASRRRGLPRMRSFRLVVLIVFIGALPLVGQARQLTDADYARAVKFLSQSTDPLVDHDVQRVKWLDATHFWYRDHDASGDHILEMDAST